jgi:hypothetical protein
MRSRPLWQITRFHPAIFLLLIIAAPVEPHSFDAAAQDVQRQAPAASKSRLSTSDIAKKTSPSVVTISSGAGIASGVIVDAGGVIVTNLHVVRGQTQVSVKLANGDIYDDVEVADVDERKDLVLLKIKAFALSAASPGNSDQVQVGDRVVLIGSPKGLDLSVSDGLISAVRDSGEGYRLFQTSAAASPGSSGAGMFNEYGELIGIVCSKLMGGENINFGIPINYVRGLIYTQARITLSDLASKFPAKPGGDQPQRSATSTDVETLTGKMLKLLEDSGLKYEKSGDRSWTVTYKGKNRATVTVHISVYEDLAVIQSIIAEAAKPTTAQMTEMLKLNLDVDLVKASLQGDNNLIALNETEMRLLDASGLKRIVIAVAAFADDLAGVMNQLPAEENAPSLTMPSQRDGYASLSLLQDHATVRYDSTQWKGKKSDEPGIYDFQYSAGDLWLRVITERLEIPMESMADIMLANAKSVDPNAKIVRRGSRTVNGLRMLFLEIEGSTSGVPFSYYEHYYSDSFGTIQIVGWTGRSLLNEYRDTIERMVSGFEVRRRLDTPWPTPLCKVSLPLPAVCLPAYAPGSSNWHPSVAEACRLNRPRIFT